MDPTATEIMSEMKMQAVCGACAQRRKEKLATEVRKNRKCIVMHLMFVFCYLFSIQLRSLCLLVRIILVQFTII